MCEGAIVSVRKLRKDVKKEYELKYQFSNY